MDIKDIIIGLIVGLGLSSAVGFRVFVPLFLLSLFSYLGYLPFDLGENWKWVGSLTAVIGFGFATLLETFGYYIPWVDNVLDTITTPAATVAGTFLMASQLTGMEDHFLMWALAIIAGGGTAAAVSGATAGTRATTSATTGGMANPILSTAELGTASALGVTSLLSLSSPVLFVVLVLLLVLVAYVVYKLIQNFMKIRKKIFS